MSTFGARNAFSLRLNANRNVTKHQHDKISKFTSNHTNTTKRMENESNFCVYFEKFAAIQMRLKVDLCKFELLICLQQLKRNENAKI